MTDNPLLRHAAAALRRHPARARRARISRLLAEHRARVAQIEAHAESDLRERGGAARGDCGTDSARVWSPVGHLNAVMNSDGSCARPTTPACRCCPPTRPIWRRASAVPRLPHIAEASEAEPRPGAARGARACAARFSARRRRAGCRAQGALQGRDDGAVAAVRRVRGERARCDQRLDAPRHRRGRSCAASTRRSSSRRAARAHDEGLEGWLFGLDQPTYVAVVTDAESAPLRRAFYEAWSTRASDQGPGAGRFDNTAVMEEILRLRHEAAQLLDFPSYAEYALADRMARTVPEVIGVPARAACAARHAAKGEFAELEQFAGRRSMPGMSPSTPSGCSRAASRSRRRSCAPYLPLPRVLSRPVRSGREALRRAHPRAQRGAAVAPGCALLRGAQTPPARRSRASTSMPTRAQQAQRRLDG
jgi:oligopeptidase A